MLTRHLEPSIPYPSRRCAVAILLATTLVTFAARVAHADEQDAAAPAPASTPAPVPALLPSADSDAEKARITKLLAMADESARDKRVIEATEALSFGVTLAGAGVASWATESKPSERDTRDVLGGVFVGVGSLLVVGSALSLAISCDDDPGPDTIAEKERRLYARAKEAKTERTVNAVVSFVFGALELGGGIALEAAADDRGLKWLGRGLMAGGAGAAILGIGQLAVRSEPERLADLWRSSRSSSGSMSPSASPSPSPGSSPARSSPAGSSPAGSSGFLGAPARAASSSIRVVPQIGLGSIGIGGTF